MDTIHIHYLAVCHRLWRSNAGAVLMQKSVGAILLFIDLPRATPSPGTTVEIFWEGLHPLKPTSTCEKLSGQPPIFARNAYHCQSTLLCFWLSRIGCGSPGESTSGWTYWNLKGMRLFIRRRGRELDLTSFQNAQAAESLYRGDLLEGCLSGLVPFERETEDLYFGLVDKRWATVKPSQLRRTGSSTAEAAGYDRAAEGTHLRMMRMISYQASDWRLRTV